MHLRYDLKNKLDFSKLGTQAAHFLNKEDCVFSFYLNDFAISFSIEKLNGYNIAFSISELAKPNGNGDSFYQTINFYQDARFKELFFIREIAESSNGHLHRSTTDEVIDTMKLITKALYKLNKLTFVI